MTRFDFEAIGTKWIIDVTKELSVEEEALLLSKIKNRIDDFDKTYSRFREDSLVFEMSRRAGVYELPKDADLLITSYKKIYDKTFGLVTPLIGQVLIDAGYDHKYSLKPKEMKTPPVWGEVLDWQNPNLTLKKPEMLDFGAGGKGYLVDIISELLEKEGVHNYTVDAGGDIRQRSESNKSLEIGLEHPDLSAQTGKTELVIGKVKLLNKSLCGSAGNRRKWANFHHVIDPEKLTSPKHILAVWTLAETTLLADLLSTAVFFVSPEILKNHFEFEYLVVREGNIIEKSDNFPVELFN